MDPVQQLYFTTAAIIVVIGIYCVIYSRNMIKTIIGIEIITAAVNLNFLALGSKAGAVDSLAQSIVFTSIVIGAAVAAIALSLIIQVFRHYRTTDLRKLRRLRW